MEIYLVRHTTPDIEKGICYGQSDLGVASSFDTEVAKIHTTIPLHEISEVYSSPLERCKRLAATFNKPITFDERLKELNFGNWELKAWNDIDPTELDPWMEDFVNVPVPYGESYIMLQKRILNLYNSLEAIPNKKIIIVSHAGPIRALLSYIRQIDLQDSFSINIKYGDVIMIQKTS